MQTLEQQQAFLHAHNTSVMGHSGQSLLDHLLGVRGILKDWGGSDVLLAAGLFHSVYGTESFRQEALPTTLRSEVRDVIGAAAERLAYVFGAMEKTTFDASVARGTAFSVVDRHTGKTTKLDEAEWAALCTLVVANWLEQRPRVRPEHKFLKAEMFRALRTWLDAPAYEALTEAYGFSPA